MNEFQLLGRRIRELRKKRHLTQEELAKKAGLHFKFVGGIERGTVNTTLRALKKIATALGVSVADLFRYEPHVSDAKQLRKQLAEAIRGCSDSEAALLYRFCRSL